MYRVDGIFINRWDALRHVLLRALPAELSSRDRASSCRARTNPQDPRRGAYILWRQERLFELWRLWDADDPSRSIRSARVIPNAGGGAPSALDMKTIGELAPTLLPTARRGAG